MCRSGFQMISRNKERVPHIFDGSCLQSKGGVCVDVDSFVFICEEHVMTTVGTLRGSCDQ